jgi:urease accessory protein
VRRRFPWAASAAPLLLTAPGWASAHSPVPGLGAFYSGMLHPVVAPSALIALMALGLLIGQHGLVQARKAVLGLVVAVALGLVLGSQWPGLELLAALATAVCALAARRLPALALLALAIAVGMAAGLGLADMAVGSVRWVVIAGTWLGCAFLALGVAALAELARKPWQHIALRVVASWLAASAMLVLGLRWVGPVRPASVGDLPAVAMSPDWRSMTANTSLSAAPATMTAASTRLPRSGATAAAAAMAASPCAAAFFILFFMPTKKNGLRFLASR